MLKRKAYIAGKAMDNDSARDKAMDKLVMGKLRSGLNPRSPSCLDAEILAAYVERTLTSHERANCEVHLVSCAHCQEQVATLVRLSEADVPAGAQAKAAAPARAAGINWFRWAWAGPALAALLVVGIYVNGPFRRDIQQMPGPINKIQTPEPGKTAVPQLKYEDKKSKPPLPPASNSRQIEVNQPEEHKNLDKERREGGTAEKSKGPQSEPGVANGLGRISSQGKRPAETQNGVAAQTQPSAAPATAPPPASASDRVAPAREGAIATPSVRADLAKKDERGQSAAKVEGAPSGVGGGIVSGTTSNNPSANRSTSKLAINGRNAQMISPQSAAQTSNEKTHSGKAALYDDAKAKKEAQTDATESADLLEKDRDKQQPPKSVQAGTANEQVEVTSAGEAPVWRVGRHGLIERVDHEGKWKKQKSRVKADLYAVASPSGEVAWAVGESGTVLRTTDGGTTWSQASHPTTEDLVQVTATSEQAATVTTRRSQTYMTINGGATWGPATH